jgi:hypothetical protein
MVSSVKRVFVILADGQKAAFLKDTQELRLQIDIELADLVEHQGTAIGGPEQPLAFTVGSAEGALAVAKQFALRQTLGESSTVDGDERLVAAARVQGVDGLGEALLAGAGFAKDEDGKVAEVASLDRPTEDLAHGGTVADHPATGEDLAQLLLLLKACPQILS